MSHEISDIKCLQIAVFSRSHFLFQCFFSPYALISRKHLDRGEAGEATYTGSLGKPRPDLSTGLAELTAATLRATSKFVSPGIPTRPNEATVANSTKIRARKTKGKHTSRYFSIRGLSTDGYALLKQTKHFSKDR